MPQPRIYDLSPAIDEAIAVFPGDRLFSRQISLDFGKGDHLHLSSVAMTLHIGAHADAPSHYHPEGVTIERMPLDIYLGSCQVVDLTRSFDGRSSYECDLKMWADRAVLAPRVLLKTGTFPYPEQWNADFAHVGVELVNFLGQNKVCLIGIDTPSMDHSQSKVLNSHKAFYENRIAILEGLDLSEVPEGLYHLVALPLNIKGAEASPVRAILIEGDLG